MRALAVAVRPAGKTAQRSIRGNSQPFSTTLTVPSAISGANIHSEVIAIPARASTAARTPTAAPTRSRLFNATAISAPSRRKVPSAPPPPWLYHRFPPGEAGWLRRLAGAVEIARRTNHDVRCALAIRRAGSVESASRAVRRATSIPSCTRSTLRSSRTKSISRPGWRARNSGTRGIR